MVEVTLLYLTGAAPIDFELEGSTFDELPVTMTCTYGETEGNLAVFADTTFYLDVETTDEACMLPMGTHAPGNQSIRLASEISFNGPATYEVELSGLADRCNGHETVYVVAESVSLFGSSNIAPPIDVILKARTPVDG
jgi:hypothetical protein